MKCSNCGTQVIGEVKECPICKGTVKRGMLDYLYLIFVFLVALLLLISFFVVYGNMKFVFLILAVLISPVGSVLLLRKLFKSSKKIKIARICFVSIIIIVSLVLMALVKINFSDKEAVEYAAKKVALERSITSEYIMNINEYQIERNPEDADGYSLVKIVIDYTVSNQTTHESTRDVATCYAYYNWSDGKFSEDKYGE